MKVAAGRLDRVYKCYQAAYEEKALEVLRSGWYVLGKEVSTFEEEWAKYIGVKHSIGVGNGLDALCIAFRILNIGFGDEVIVCSNAFIACVIGITTNGALPIFVEPDQYDNIDAEKIEEKITARTKAILAVHLYGQACDMTRIMEIAHKHNLRVVEDCSQSHGNHWQGQCVGAIGDIGCFSLYPTKGCGAFGDAGIITTNDDKLADKVRVFRNYGSRVRYHNEVVGTNSRLDELQAALLRIKLCHMDELNEERRMIAKRYSQGIHHPQIQLPKVRPGADSTWHQYVIHVRNGRRDALMEYLDKNEIGSIIHYPIPPNMSEAYRYLGYQRGDFPIAERYADEVLSIPMYNGMTPEETDYVINKLNLF